MHEKAKGQRLVNSAKEKTENKKLFVKRKSLINDDKSDTADIEI